MMSDMKKLCKSDRFYWLIAALIMLGLVAYMMLNVLGRYLNETLEAIGRWTEIWDTHPEWENLTGYMADGTKVQVPYDMIQKMMMGIVGAAFAAQTIKILFQETKNRTEVLNLFPVKSCNRLTYHYVSGLLIVGIPILIQVVIIQLNFLHVEKKADVIFEGADVLLPYAAKTVIIFMLQYSLLIFCRKLTNHVAGTIFTFVIVDLAMQVFAHRCVGMSLNNLYDNRIQNWAFWAIITAVLIILSYVADKKKDYARNGFYAFPIVHWIIMGIIFVEVCYFSGTYENVPKVVSRLMAIAVSLLITTGVHFLTKPKRR